MIAFLIGLLIGFMAGIVINSIMTANNDGEDDLKDDKEQPPDYTAQEPDDYEKYILVVNEIGVQRKEFMQKYGKYPDVVMISNNLYENLKEYPRTIHGVERHYNPRDPRIFGMRIAIDPCTRNVVSVWSEEEE